ncbi:MAG: hypothetical protein ABI901_14405 [Roseiflexaceae bacterium]
MLPAIGQGTVAGQAHRGVGPEQAHATHQFAKQATDRDGGKQMQRDHQPDAQDGRQAPFAHFAHPFLSDHLRDGVGRDDLVEGVDGHGAAERVFGINVAYRESRAVAPMAAIPSPSTDAPTHCRH